MVKVDSYEVPEGLYYTKDFEWLKIEGDKVRVGITDYAQKQLREIVYVELPSPGSTVKQNEPYGTVESVKSVSDLVAAVSGTVEEVNEEVQSTPEILNQDPYGKGWLLVIKPSNLEEELKNIMNFNQAVEWHKSLVKKG
ncbi:glycine cleavage system protein GcvH [Candidatus Bathyarchaeota archaeon]|nr:glycine cleavage system protein GcvH [Candidatus Bathyarchaeota archaeon]RJS78661.1 MAG: glycine cleavage system protein GcvH [Candidatus Bathyarchaeota archaeon]